MRSRLQHFSDCRVPYVIVILLVIFTKLTLLRNSIFKRARDTLDDILNSLGVYVFCLTAFHRVSGNGVSLVGGL